jgi:hypothetical protein
MLQFFLLCFAVYRESKMVSLMFTFQLCLTQQSYYKEQKTCQVVSMVTSHGQQNAIPHAPANEGGAHPSTPEVDRSLSAATNDEADQVSPNSAPSDDVPSPLAASVSCFSAFHTFRTCQMPSLVFVMQLQNFAII